MIFFLKLCAMILGLTLPGYLLARAFRLEHSWAAAFPLSALCMVETIIFFALTGIPMRFGTMAIALLLCAGVCFIFTHRRRPAEPASSETRESSGLPRHLVVVILVIAASVLVTVTLRTTLFPLRGADTIFRWEGLARAMLQHQSLTFYPPVTAADYTIYLHPDGIPPLVATIYWWLYATVGTPLPSLTAISVGMQLTATMALTFYGTRHAFGAKAAWFALLAVATTPLLLNGFAIGQETGFTALAVAGQLCFAWAAARKPRLAPVIVAALFATLGALTRDYGPALALAGFAVLAWHRQTRRYLPVFLLTTVLLSAPWYLRSWAWTGNPFFSHRLPGGFDVNTIHVAIIDYYKDVYSFAQFDLARWLDLVKHLCAGAFLVLCVGVPQALRHWRESMPLLLTTLLVTLLWIISVGQTAGGVIYSTRVLTPAVVALAIAAGAAGSRMYESYFALRHLMRQCASVGLILLAGYALVSAALYPGPARYGFSTPTDAAAGSFQQVMIEQLEATNFPPTGVLTDAPFFGEILKQHSRFRPVMFWSPEVDFIFNPQLAPREIQRRLVKKNIRLIFIDDQSTINRFLSRHNFFRESDDWKLLFEYPNQGAFYYFEPR